MAVGYKSKLNGAFSQPVDLDDVYVRKEYFDTGNLWAWGRGSESQLGDNTTTTRSSPVQTVAGGTNWKQVSASIYSTAAIKTDGTLWTWGINTFGGLGDNTTTTRSSPVQTVTGGSTWKQVSGGNYNMSAIKTDGTLWTWGINYYGALGDNTTTNRSSPVQTVTGGSTWKQVSVASYNMSAIKTDGTLWSWGYNTKGQLGDNTITNKSSPVQTVAGGTNWKQVACGFDGTTSAIKTDGTLWVWGDNSFGQADSNTAVNKSSPVQFVSSGAAWKQVAEHSYNGMAAIKTDGTLWLWGINSYGVLGDNTTTNKSSSPVQTVAGGTNWKQVSASFYSIAAIKTDGTLWTWGSNYSGQLGDNTIVPKSSPIQTVAGGSTWKQVSGGGYTFMALKG